MPTSYLGYPQIATEEWQLIAVGGQVVAEAPAYANLRWTTTPTNAAPNSDFEGFSPQIHMGSYTQASSDLPDGLHYWVRAQKGAAINVVVESPV